TLLSTLRLSKDVFSAWVLAAHDFPGGVLAVGLFSVGLFFVGLFSASCFSVRVAGFFVAPLSSRFRLFPGTLFCTLDCGRDQAIYPDAGGAPADAAGLSRLLEIRRQFLLAGYSLSLYELQNGSAPSL